MSYAEQKAAIVAHAVAAGAAITPPIQNVAAAFPVAAAGEPSIRIYYGGEADTEHMGGRWTLGTGTEMIARKTIIEAFWPITTLDTEQAAIVDSQMDQMTHEIRTRLNGDADLGGKCENLTVNYAEPLIIIGSNTRWGTIAWEVVTDYIEYQRARTGP